MTFCSIYKPSFPAFISIPALISGHRECFKLQIYLFTLDLDIRKVVNIGCEGQYFQSKSFTWHFPTTWIWYQPLKSTHADFLVEKNWWTKFCAFLVLHLSVSCLKSYWKKQHCTKMKIEANIPAIQINDSNLQVCRMYKKQNRFVNTLHQRDFYLLKNIENHLTLFQCWLKILR